MSCTRVPGSADTKGMAHPTLNRSWRRYRSAIGQAGALLAVAFAIPLGLHAINDATAPAVDGPSVVTVNSAILAVSFPKEWTVKRAERAQADPDGLARADVAIVSSTGRAATVEALRTALVKSGYADVSVTGAMGEPVADAAVEDVYVTGRLDRGHGATMTVAGLVADTAVREDDRAPWTVHAPVGGSAVELAFDGPPTAR